MEVQAPPGCPVLPGTTLSTPPSCDNPFPGSSGPVTQDAGLLREVRILDLTKYDDVLAVLNDNEHSSNKLAIPMPLPPEDLRDRMPVYPFMTALLFMDNPEHRAARRWCRSRSSRGGSSSASRGLLAGAQELITQRRRTVEIEFLKEYALPLALT